MPMRRETLKALEERRDHLVSERKQSKMQTLGASNPHNNNKDKHRTAAKITGDTVDKIFAAAGVDNVAFERGAGSSNTDDEASSTTRNSSASHAQHHGRHNQNPLRSSISWKDRDRERALISSDQLSSSATSKM